MGDCAVVCYHNILVWGFVRYCLVFDNIVWKFISIYAALKHNNEQQHHFLCDCQYGFKVCVILFNIYSTHYKVYIHIPCINTQHQNIVPSNITHVISSSDWELTRLYQGLANHCKGNRKSDIIHLLQPSKTIHYWNQSMLVIVPYLNIFVWSITMFDLILRGALVYLCSITC